MQNDKILSKWMQTTSDIDSICNNCDEWILWVYAQCDNLQQQVFLIPWSQFHCQLLYQYRYRKTRNNADSAKNKKCYQKSMPTYSNR